MGADQVLMLAKAAEEVQPTRTLCRKHEVFLQVDALCLLETLLQKSFFELRVSVTRKTLRFDSNVTKKS